MKAFRKEIHKRLLCLLLVLMIIFMMIAQPRLHMQAEAMADVLIGGHLITEGMIGLLGMLMGMSGIEVDTYDEGLIKKKRVAANPAADPNAPVTQAEIEENTRENIIVVTKQLHTIDPNFLPKFLVTYAEAQMKQVGDNLKNVATVTWGWLVDTFNTIKGAFSSNADITYESTTVYAADDWARFNEIMNTIENYESIFDDEGNLKGVRWAKPMLSVPAITIQAEPSIGEAITMPNGDVIAAFPVFEGMPHYILLRNIPQNRYRLICHNTLVRIANVNGTRIHINGLQSAYIYDPVNERWNLWFANSGAGDWDLEPEHKIIYSSADIMHTITGQGVYRPAGWSDGYDQKEIPGLPIPVPLAPGNIFNDTPSLDRMRQRVEDGLGLPSGTLDRDKEIGLVVPNSLPEVIGKTQPEIINQTLVPAVPIIKVHPNTPQPKPRIIDVFPFCIPFDFMRAIQSLAVAPNAPVFAMDFSGIEMFQGFVWELDMSDYESLARVVRWGVFFSFVVGLMFATRKLMKW